MRVARPVELDKEPKGMLEQIARGRSLAARLEERARIVLRAGRGMQDQQIAAELGITPEKVARWRNRYLDGGIEALEKDAPRQATDNHQRPQSGSDSQDHTGKAFQFHPLEYAHDGCSYGTERNHPTPHLACQRPKAALAEEFQGQQRCPVC